jgi:hypothetical protein
MARAKKRGGRPRKRRHISVAPTPFNGDHGTGTQAATHGTVLEAVTDEKGANPNHMGRRRRVDALDAINLTMRQRQAAEAIRDAYSRVQMLSSGSPLKEQVQSSPKPDATIAAQVDANSRWVYVTKPIPWGARPLIEHVCCYNEPLRTSGFVRSRELFCLLLDRVANHLRY